MLDSQTGPEKGGREEGRQTDRQIDAGPQLAFSVPLFSQSRTPAHGMVLPTFRVGLSLLKL